MNHEMNEIISAYLEDLGKQIVSLLSKDFSDEKPFYCVHDFSYQEKEPCFFLNHGFDSKWSEEDEEGVSHLFVRTKYLRFDLNDPENTLAFLSSDKERYLMAIKFAENVVKDFA